MVNKDSKKLKITFSGIKKVKRNGKQTSCVYLYANGVCFEKLIRVTHRGWWIGKKLPYAFEKGPSIFPEYTKKLDELQALIIKAFKERTDTTWFNGWYS